MNIKKVTAAGKRLGAAAGIITNLTTVPVTKDVTPTLPKQVAKYSKEVRLAETRRRISRQITKDLKPTSALDKGTSKRLRKGA